MSLPTLHIAILAMVSLFTATSCQTPNNAQNPYGGTGVGAGYGGADTSYPPAPTSGTYRGGNSGGYTQPNYGNTSGNYGNANQNNNNTGGAYGNSGGSGYDTPNNDAYGNSGGGNANGGNSGNWSENQGGGNTNAGGGRSHRVMKGDTLSSLSRRYGSSIPNIMRANNLNDSTIRIGQSLTIP